MNIRKPCSAVALVAVLGIIPGIESCAQISSYIKAATMTRGQLLEQLGAESEGPQSDGSVVKCMSHKKLAPNLAKAWALKNGISENEIQMVKDREDAPTVACVKGTPAKPEKKSDEKSKEENSEERN
jgi:hypothetical protein